MTSKKQLQAEVEELTSDVSEYQDQLYLAGKWVDAMLELHQPKTGRLYIDASTTATDSMREVLLNRLGQDLFCLEGCGRWPCKELDRLRGLGRMIYPTTYSRAEALELIDTIERKPGSNVIETAI